MRTKNLYVRGVALGAMLLSAGVVLAQERPRAAARGQEQKQEQRQQRITTNRPVGQAANADQTIAQCLAISNAEEVSLGTLAAAKSQNPEVKQFAEKLVKDHNQFIAELQKSGAQPIVLGGARAGAAPDPAGVVERGAERREERREARKEARDGDVAVREGVAEQRTAASRDGGLDFLHIKQQMAEKCVETAQKNWNELKGKDADMCFLGSQAVLHQQMLDGMQVLRQYASPELQSTIDQGISTTQAHLEHAKKLIDSVAAAEKSAPAEPSKN